MSKDRHTAEIFRFAQPLFLALVLIGCGTASVFVLLLGMRGAEADLCALLVWVGQIAYDCGEGWLAICGRRDVVVIVSRLAEPREGGSEPFASPPPLPLPS